MKRKEALAKVEKVFAAASVSADTLLYIPGTAVHEFMVSADAWLDPQARLLMFVSVDAARMHQFLYNIGEERNHNVVGVGRGIAAFQLSVERVDWLTDLVSKAKR